MVPTVQAAAPTSLTVVALGDSVTAGSSCDCDAFPRVYASALSAQRDADVSLVNDGEAGETSSDVLADLSDKHEAQDVADADVVLLTIGANDFGDLHDTIGTSACGSSDLLGCTSREQQALSDHLDSIFDRVDQLRSGKPTVVLATGYWNVFEDGDVGKQVFSAAGRDASDQLTQDVNRVIARAADRADATYVDLYVPFKGGDGPRDPTDLLAADGDHPDAAGHRLIAAELLDAGYHAQWPPTQH